MRKLFDSVTDRLRSFIEQRDNLGLVVRCPESESSVVLKILEGLDEASSSELYWLFIDDFTGPQDYISSVVQTFTTKHTAIRLAMEQEGMEPWPEIPSAISDESLPPNQRLRELMTFSRALLPVMEDGLIVWVMFPFQIQDGSAYTRLMWEVFEHKYPFPWCHHMRVIFRDDAEDPALANAAQKPDHIDWYEPDLSQEAIQESMEETAADEDLPMDERLQSVMVMATMDYSHKRYDLAQDKYRLILPYYVKTDNGLMASMVMNSMGECHREMGDMEQAEVCFELAIEAAMENDPPPIPILLNIYLNLANLTLSQERWAEAGVYYDGAQQMAIAQLNPRVHIQSIENRGFALYMQGKVEEALISWTQGAEVAQKVEEKELEKSILERLEKHFVKTGDRDKQQEVMQEIDRLNQASTSQS